MSYRNPTIAVDTQSGKYVQDMQKSIAKSYAQYANTLGTIEEEQLKKQTARNKENAFRRNQIDAKLVSSNAGLLKGTQGYSKYRFNNYNKVLKQYAGLMSNEFSTFGENQMKSHMANSGQIIKSYLVETMAGKEAFQAALAKGTGVMGGISKFAKQRNIQYISQFYKIKGYEDSDVYADFDLNEDGLNMTLSTEVTYWDSETNSFKTELRTADPRDSSSLPSGDIIPDISKRTQATISEALKNIRFEDKNSPIYKDLNDPNKVYNQDTDQDSGGKQKRFANPEVFAKNIRQVIKAQYFGGSSNIYSAKELIALHNNVFSKGDKDMILQQENWIEYTQEDRENTKDKELQRRIKNQDAAQETIVDGIVDYAVNTSGINLKFLSVKGGEVKKEETYKEEAQRRLNELLRDPGSAILGSDGAEQGVAYDPETTMVSFKRVVGKGTNKRLVDVAYVLDTKNGLMNFVRTIGDKSRYPMKVRQEMIDLVNASEKGLFDRYNNQEDINDREKNQARKERVAAARAAFNKSTKDKNWDIGLRDKKFKESPEYKEAFKKQ